jgi:hypothetical protein
MSSTPVGKSSGWPVFVGVYLLTVGILNVLWGIAAIAGKSNFVEDGLVWSTLTTWGWVVLVVGAVQLLGAGLVSARRAGGAMIAGFLAFLGLLVNFLSIGAYPIWSVILMSIDALILWAVTVHSDEFV